MCKSRIHAKSQFVKMGWQGDSRCVFWQVMEDVDPLFVNCTFIKGVRIFFDNQFGVPVNSDTSDELIKKQ